MGPNGSGKSTLTNLFVRFWDYTEGSIRIGDTELRELPADDARALFGVVPQHTHLFNATVRDNLYVAKPDADDDELVAACRQAQIHDFIANLPQGYDTMIGENGVLLSGGERQRLAIARAVLKGAPILILDEATSQLDPLTEQALLASLRTFMARAHDHRDLPPPGSVSVGRSSGNARQRACCSAGGQECAYERCPLFVERYAGDRLAGTAIPVAGVAEIPLDAVQIGVHPIQLRRRPAA